MHHYFKEMFLGRSLCGNFVRVRLLHSQTTKSNIYVLGFDLASYHRMLRYISLN